MNGYLREPYAFGSPYDQADGTKVEYPAGTLVRVIISNMDQHVWITAPNGREALVPENAVILEKPEVVRIDGRYVCVNCGKQARDHSPSKKFPWPTFVTMCDGREVKT